VRNPALHPPPGVCWPQLVRKDWLVPRDRKDLLEPMELPAHKGLRARLARRVQQGQTALPVPKAQQDHKVRKDLPVQMVLRVHKARRALRAHPLSGAAPGT
jgi:hypothetical protein